MSNDKKIAELSMEEVEKELEHITRCLSEYHAIKSTKNKFSRKCNKVEFVYKMMFWYKVRQCQDEKNKRCNYYKPINTFEWEYPKQGLKIDCACLDSHNSNKIERRQP